MLIVCLNCATSYDVDVATLRPDGRKVRCVRCRSVWQPELSRAEKIIAAAEELAPARRAVKAVAAIAEMSGGPPAETVAGAEAAPAAPEPPLDAPVRGAASGVAEAAGFAEAAQSLKVDTQPIAPADLDAGETLAAVEAEPHEAVNDLPREDLPHEDLPHEDVESVAARRYPRRAKRKGWHWPLSHLQSAIMGLIIANAIIIGWRTDFVRAMPQTASFYALIGMPVNLRGLDFDNLATATEQHEGVPILVVEGNIVNDTNKAADVPHVRFAVRNAARQEIYSWSAVPSRTILPPGEAVAFRSRLASPPPDAHDVLVRFVNRYDILNGNR
jgi:predicted Zn finger-like uncharacterized protein